VRKLHVRGTVLDGALKTASPILVDVFLRAGAARTSSGSARQGAVRGAPFRSRKMAAEFFRRGVQAAGPADAFCRVRKKIGRTLAGGVQLGLPDFLPGRQHASLDRARSRDNPGLCISILLPASFPFAVGYMGSVFRTRRIACILVTSSCVQPGQGQDHGYRDEQLSTVRSAGTSGFLSHSSRLRSRPFIRIRWFTPAA